MRPVAEHHQFRTALALADFDGAALGGFVDEQMRHPAQRELYPRPDLRLVGRLGQLFFQPALMAREEPLDLAAGDSWRHRDAQSAPARIDAQREPACPRVLDDAQRQRTAGDRVLALLDAADRAGGELVQKGEGHGIWICDSGRDGDNFLNAKRRR